MILVVFNYRCLGVFREFLPAVAGNVMIKSRMVEFWLFHAADVDGVAAAGLEFAAWWRIDR